MLLIKIPNINVNTVYIMFSFVVVCLVKKKVCILLMYIIETVLLMKAEREKSNKFKISNGRSL